MSLQDSLSSDPAPFGPDARGPARRAQPRQNHEEEGLTLPDLRGVNRGLSVLVIEDCDIDAEVILGLLKEDGRVEEIRHAADGGEALRILESGLAPDVILTDLSMPALNGFEVIRSIRAEESDQVDLFSRWEQEPRRVPIVVLTSSDRVSDFHRANRSLANCFITKPNELSELRLLLRRVIKLVIWGKTMPPHLDASSAEAVAQQIQKEADATHRRLSLEEATR